MKKPYERFMLMVTESDIVHALRMLGLNGSSAVIVHSSLRSFGNVEGGAYTVCQTFLSIGATLLLPAGSWNITGIPAPPGLLRPWNAVGIAATWRAFDEAVSCAAPFSDHLPIDKELGIIPETMRRSFPHLRSRHPLMSYIALGTHAQHLIGAQRLDMITIFQQSLVPDQYHKISPAAAFDKAHQQLPCERPFASLRASGLSSEPCLIASDSSVSTRPPLLEASK